MYVVNMWFSEMYIVSKYPSIQTHMYIHVCYVCMLRICMLRMYVTYVCYVCMLCVYVTYVCYVCMLCVYVTYVCYVCMLRMYVTYVTCVCYVCMLHPHLIDNYPKCGCWDWPLHLMKAWQMQDAFLCYPMHVCMYVCMYCWGYPFASSLTNCMYSLVLIHSPYCNL